MKKHHGLILAWLEILIMISIIIGVYAVTSIFFLNFSSAKADGGTYLETDGYVEWDRELIMDLQRGLNANLKTINKALPKGKKFSELTVDGVLGPETAARLKWFQKAKGLTIDGICGPKTWEALGYDHTELVYYAPNLFDGFGKGTSDYAVLLTLDTHLFRVYQIEEDGWLLLYEWKAATGNQSEGHFTPVGCYLLTSEGNHREITGKNSNGKKWGADNATRICRNAFGTFYIHSTLKWWKNGKWASYDDDSALGRSVTHGCVRLNRKKAKWVAENLRNNTAIIIVDRDPLK